MSWSHTATGKVDEVVAELEKKATEWTSHPYANAPGKLAVERSVAAARELAGAADHEKTVTMSSSGHFDDSGAGNATVSLLVQVRGAWKGG